MENIEENTEENIEVNIANKKLSSWKSKIRPKDIAIILIVALLSALAYCITPTTSLAPGIQYRLFAFITPTLGIVMGKYRGGITAAIAEGIWVLISFYILDIPVLSIATPFALFGDFLQAYIPGLICEKWGKQGGITPSVHNLGVILLGAFIGMVAFSVWFGIFFDLLDVAPFMVIFNTLWESDFLPMMIGTAPLTWILIKSRKIRREWKRRW